MSDKKPISEHLRQQIASSSLFSGLPDAAIDTLIQGGRLETFRTSESLIEENQDNASLLSHVRVGLKPSPSGEGFSMI